MFKIGDEVYVLKKCKYDTDDIDRIGKIDFIWYDKPIVVSVKINEHLVRQTHMSDILLATPVVRLLYEVQSGG